MMKKTFTFTTLLLFLTLPSLAWGKLPDEINEEVTRYIEKFEQSSDLDVRKGVIIARAFVNEKEKMLPILSSSLKDPKIDIRFLSAFSLYEQTEGETQKKWEIAMLELLKSPQANQRFYDTVFSLLPESLKFSLLKQALESSKESTPFAIYGFLARQNNAFFELFKKELLDPQTSSAALKSVLKNLNEKYIEVATQMLASNHEVVQNNGLTLLLRLDAYPDFRKKIKPILQKEAASKNLSIATAVTYRLLETKALEGKQAADNLLKRLSDPLEKASLLVKMADCSFFVEKKEVASYFKDKNQALKEAAYIVSARDPEVAQEIMKMVKSTDFAERTLALRAAGYTDLDQAAQYLQKSLFEARVDIRRLSAQSLAKLKKGATVDAIKKSISRESDLATKLSLIEALGKIGTPEAVTLLVFNSRDKNNEIKKGIVEALGRTKQPQAISQLDSLVLDRNREIQWLAFVNLLKVAPKHAEKHFETVFRNPPEGFLIDFDELPEQTRKIVYSYLLTKNNGAGRDALLGRLMITGSYRQSLDAMMTNDALLPRVREQMVTFLADRGEKKDWLILQNIARNSKNNDIKNLATWYLLRDPAQEEATYRGFFLLDDPVKASIGAAGLAMIHQIKGKTKKRTKKKKK